MTLSLSEVMTTKLNNLRATDLMRELVEMASRYGWLARDEGVPPAVICDALLTIVRGQQRSVMVALIKQLPDVPVEQREEHLEWRIFLHVYVLSKQEEERTGSSVLSD